MMELCLLAVDDESLALSDLTAALQTAEPTAAVHAYTDPCLLYTSDAADE